MAGKSIRIGEYNDTFEERLHKANDALRNYAKDLCIDSPGHNSDDIKARLYKLVDISVDEAVQELHDFLEWA
jgi:hypothetical protein